MWFQLFMLVVSLVISAVTAPKAAPPKPASLSDFDFPQSTEGTAEAVVFGDVWIEDWFVTGVGNFRKFDVKTKGGK